MRARALAALRAAGMRYAVAFLGFAIIGGCATAPLAPRDARAFDVLGRVLVTYSGGAVTSNLRWEHAADRDEIWLMTPTGQTLAHVLDTPEGAILTRADQQQFRAGSVEALTQRALGWPLPLTLLQYWMRGAAAPGSDASVQERDKDGRLVAFIQNGWQVSVMYQTQGELAGRARRLDLKDGANEIRFVIDTWRESAGD
jgi:outer membrane lipoprotein LolB